MGRPPLGWLESYVRASAAGSALALDRFKRVASEVEGKSPVKAAGVRSGEIAEDEIAAVEKVVGIGNAEVDPFIDAAVGGALRRGCQVLRGRRTVEESRVRADRNTGGSRVEKEVSVGPSVKKAEAVGLILERRGKQA